MELSTKLSSLEKHGEPTPKMAIKELTRKAGYRILEAKKVDTKFDRKAVMLLVEVDSTKTAVTFLPIVHLCRRCTVTCGDHMQLLVFIIVGLLTQYCVRADSVKMISVIIAAYSLYLRVIDLLSTPSPPPCPLSRSSSFISSTVSWGSVSSGWEFFWDSESEESESGYSTLEEEEEEDDEFDLRGGGGGGWNGWREY
ncbi:hypothetical protein J6590_076626 [Homalodisca vitripennis]|nr:hypothetical protein J6590_076626 [Homalodisca vitripennis]